MHHRSAIALVLAVAAPICSSCAPGVVQDTPVADVRADLVLAGTATASSVEGTGLEATKAVDGNLSTRWSSKFSDPQWLTVDLGSIHSVNRVTINWQNSYAKDYQVRVSTDNATWTTIQSITNSDGGLDDLQGLSGSGRYVQVYGTRRATQYGYSIFEIQIAAPDATTGAGGSTGGAGTTGTAGTTGGGGTTGTAGTTGGAGTTGTAGGAGTTGTGGAGSTGTGGAVPYTGLVATASSVQGTGLEAAKAVDGNTSTRWSSAFSDPQWLTVDLGSTKSVSRVVLTWEAAYAKAYQIRVSNDNATWTTIKSVTAGDGGTDDLTGLAGSGRYVQMYGTTRATAYGYSLWEMQVWGSGGSGGTGAAGSGGSTGAAGSTGTGGTTGAAGSGGSTGAAGSTGAGGTTCKRGEAYGSHSAADLLALSSPSAGIRWWYNWAKTPDSGAASSYQSDGVEFVPMVWGSNFISGAASQIPKGSKYLLTFNEPNFGSQSNLTPAQAAALWPQIEQIANSFNPPLKIVSPSPNYCGGNCNETNPFTWFDEFFAACPGCRVDYVAVHWYACSLSALQSHINNAKKYGKPIWLTEWSCLDSPGDAPGEKTYMDQAVPYLESEPAVFRYAWFTGRDGTAGREALLDAGSGQLTPLGQDYVSLAPICR